MPQPDPELYRAAENALLKAVAVSADKGGAGEALAYAEAYAWLRNTNQSHGGRGSN